MWEQEFAPGSGWVEPSGDTCDHYHRYPDDIAQMADLGFNAYRFGVEWARAEPEDSYWSIAALDHYKRMVTTCHEHGITPVVTYNHFAPAVVLEDRRLGAAERLTGSPITARESPSTWATSSTGRARSTSPTSSRC